MDSLVRIHVTRSDEIEAKINPDFLHARFCQILVWLRSKQKLNWIFTCKILSDISSDEIETKNKPDFYMQDSITYNLLTLFLKTINRAVCIPALGLLIPPPPVACVCVCVCVCVCARACVRVRVCVMQPLLCGFL